MGVINHLTKMGANVLKGAESLVVWKDFMQRFDVHSEDETMWPESFTYLSSPLTKAAVTLSKYAAGSSVGH